MVVVVVVVVVETGNIGLAPSGLNGLEKVEAGGGGW